jgi:hypothetical protein
LILEWYLWYIIKQKAYAQDMHKIYVQNSSFQQALTHTHTHTHTHYNYLWVIGLGMIFVLNAHLFFFSFTNLHHLCGGGSAIKLIQIGISTEQIGVLLTIQQWEPALTIGW